MYVHTQSINDHGVGHCWAGKVEMKVYMVVTQYAYDVMI